MTLPTEPLTVVRLTVDGYKRIKAADITPNATGLVPVRGRNAQGKSSLIESMIAALLGRKGAQPLPITEGEHGADVVVDLGQLVVRRHWTRDSAGKATSKLSVTGSDGSDLKSPQAILDALVGEFADPVAFLEMKPDDQVKTTLQVLGLAGQVNGLETQAAELYERRRDLGRDSDRLGKAAAALTAEVDGLPAPPTEGTIEELTTELQRIQAHNAGIETQKRAMATAQNRGLQAQDRLERLQAEVEKLEQEIEAQRTDWDAAAAAVKGKAVEDAQPVVLALQAHEEAAKHAGRRELLDQTRADAQKAQQEHATCDEALTAKRGEISALLAATEFPMEGVTYNPETKQLLVGTVPFAQASQAERLKLAASVAMMGNPQIKVMFAREGSLLDDESRAQLAAIAEANGFQLWLEVVDSNPEGVGVWVEDGEAEISEQPE